MTSFKSRTRSGTIVYWDGRQEKYTTTCELLTTQTKRPNQWNECYHLKEVVSGRCSYYGNWYFYPDMNPLSFLGNPEQFMGIAREHLYVPLDFQQNDDFEIINFVKELDETIGMFTMKFMRSLTTRGGYGAFTWGVIPFMQDVKSILASIADIYNGIERTMEKYAGKRVSRTLNISFTKPVSSGIATFSGSARVSGYFDMQQAIPANPQEAILVLLDEIGFHPDLKTIWDLLPFSFVADYFLPIGDLLESLHPRGWFCPTIRIDGAWSLKGTIKVTCNERSQFHGDAGSAEFYYRSPMGDIVLPTRPPVVPEWQAPSLRELFNTWYLLMSRR